MAKEFVTTGHLKVHTTSICRHIGARKENVLLLLSTNDFVCATETSWGRVAAEWHGTHVSPQCDTDERWLKLLYIIYKQ